MLERKKKNLPKEIGIVWKKSFWKRRTTVLYANEEVGYFQMKGWFSYGGKGELMKRPFVIKSENVWQSRFTIFDEVSDTVVAKIKINLWNYRTRLFVEDKVFIFKQSIWGNGTWWWQRENGTPEENNEKLIKTSVTNFFSGKGTFSFGDTKDNNLNALILGGLFIATLRNESEAAGAFAGVG